MDLSAEEIAERMQQACRHRARYLPPDTPEHFWSIGFPDTQECKDRGQSTRYTLIKTVIIKYTEM